METKEAKQFGEFIAKRRKELGLSQGKLAKELGLTGSMVGYYEGGKRKPSGVTLVRLASVLKVPIKDLLKIGLPLFFGEVFRQIAPNLQVSVEDLMRVVLFDMDPDGRINDKLQEVVKKETEALSLLSEFIVMLRSFTSTERVRILKVANEIAKMDLAE